MKKFLLLILLAGCEREEFPGCKRCAEHLLYESADTTWTDIPTNTKYCEGEWMYLDGRVTKDSGLNNEGWWKTTVTFKCQ